MHADADQGTVVAQLSALRERRPTLVRVADEEILLIRLGDEVVAITNICPHAGGEMRYGYVQGTTIECPLHMARFDLRSGAALYNPAVVARTYRVALRGDDVLLWTD